MNLLGFLDFEAPARVSKNPNLGVDFLDFWNFGNSRNLFGFWILRLFFFFQTRFPARYSGSKWLDPGACTGRIIPIYSMSRPSPGRKYIEIIGETNASDFCAQKYQLEIIPKINYFEAPARISKNPIFG